MKQKSKPSAKLISALLAAILLVCFTACQPTPETEAVVGRQEDILANVTSVPFVKIATPEHISETYDEYANLIITYDTDVTVPDGAAYPVTEVKKRIFTDNDILSFIKLCAGKNDELYSTWELKKDEYLQKLAMVKQYKGTERVTSRELEDLQQQYKKAPAEVDRPRVNNISELPADTYSYVYIENQDYTTAKIIFMRHGNLFSYSRNMFMNVYSTDEYTYYPYDKNVNGPMDNYLWHKPGKPEISQEDAFVKASEYLDAMGVDDLILYNAQPCSLVTDYIDKVTGWQFTFTRSISGLQAQYRLMGSECFDPINMPMSTPSYGSPWGQEVLQIIIDRDGLCRLQWQGASVESRTAVESAQLDDFKSIQQRITDQLSYYWGMDKTEIRITEIELGISMISAKDKHDIGIYLPTWYVCYNHRNPKYDDDNVWWSSQIMFNALDGSFIEPRLTNDEIMESMDFGPSSPENSSGETTPPDSPI